MGLSVTVNLEGYPQGETLGIIGIGQVENGGTVEVDEAGEAAFFAANGNTIENALKDAAGYTVSGSGTFQTPEGWEPPDTEEAETQPPAPAPAPAPSRPEPPTTSETTPTEGGA